MKTMVGDDPTKTKLNSEYNPDKQEPDITNCFYYWNPSELHVFHISSILHSFDTSYLLKRHLLGLSETINMTQA